MPAYRFSWSPFEVETCAALARAIGYVGNDNGAREYLSVHVKRPDDEFIRTCKDVLATRWLPKHRGIGELIVRELFDRRMGPMGRMPDDAAGYARYVDACRNTSGLRDLLFARLVSFGDQDRFDEGASDDGNFVPRFGLVTPAKQASQTRSPYPPPIS